MASEKYILVRPPQLPELQAIGQGVYLVGYDQQTDRTVKVNVQSIGGGEQAPNLIWRADTEYNSDSIVEFGLRLWKSLVNNNVGNIPLEGDNWTEVARSSAATTSIPNWAAGVYTHSPTVVLRNNAIYRLTRPVPYESTDFEAEAAASPPVWEKIQSGGGHTIYNGETLIPQTDELNFDDEDFEVTDEGGQTVVRGKTKTYTIDFGTTSLVAQDINMFRSAKIVNIAGSNINTILLTYSGGLQQPISLGINNIDIEANDILTWEITRINEGEIASLGIKLELNNTL